MQTGKSLLTGTSCQVHLTLVGTKTSQYKYSEMITAECVERSQPGLLITTRDGYKGVKPHEVPKKETGHLPHYEQPQIVNPILVDFLQNAAP